MPSIRATSLLARLAIVPFLLAAIVLLLSDRAPAATLRALRRFQLLGHRIEEWIGFDVIDLDAIPLGWERAAHMALWAAGACTVMVAFGRSGPTPDRSDDGGLEPWRVAAIVFGLSCAFELGQVLFTATRQLEWVDIGSNGVGVVLGVVAGVIFCRLRGPSPRRS